MTTGLRTGSKGRGRAGAAEQPEEKLGGGSTLPQERKGHTGKREKS